MRCTPTVSLILIALALPLAAQAPDTTRVDSITTDTTPPAPPAAPTPEQQRYLEGLRRVARGISQLRIGVDQATRAQTATDSLARRRAASRLGGFCGSARSFMSGGRAQMQPMVYADTAQLKARLLVQRLDAIITYTKTCETEARYQTAAVTAEVGKRLQAFEEALSAFRIAAGLQAPADSSKPASP
ncbi:MAG TPA: hypothetical protein VGA20_11905 [Gemmatimonadales bacterium]